MKIISGATGVPARPPRRSVSKIPSTTLRCTQPARDFPSAQSVVSCVPSVDDLRFRLEGAVCQQCVVNSAAYDAPSSRALQGVGVFLAIQRDDGKALADVAYEEHCLFATDAALARHPRQSGVNLSQTVRSAAAGGLVKLNEEFLTWAVVDVVPVEDRDQHRSVEKGIHFPALFLALCLV